MVSKVIRILSTKIQNILWVLGISVHNKVTDECCLDFSCCFKETKKDRKLNTISKRYKYINVWDKNYIKYIKHDTKFKQQMEESFSNQK